MASKAVHSIPEIFYTVDLVTSDILLAGCPLELIMRANSCRRDVDLAREQRVHPIHHLTSSLPPRLTPSLVSTLSAARAGASDSLRSTSGRSFRD